MTPPRAHELTELWCELQKQGLVIGVSCVVLGSLVLFVILLTCVVAHEDVIQTFSFALNTKNHPNLQWVPRKFTNPTPVCPESFKL